MKSALPIALLLIAFMLGCAARGDPLTQAEEALTAHQEILRSIRSESRTEQIALFESRISRDLAFLERPEADLPKELVAAQRSLQKAHDAWHNAFNNLDKLKNATADQRQALEQEIKAEFATATENIQAAENSLQQFKRK
ncbi:MAG: hypothetical protein AB1489_14115 [Acidobacteriota bacterium]